MDLAGRLKERRERRGLKNSQVALYLDVSTAHVSDMESGKRKPSLELLARLAEFYRCSVDYLLGLTDDPRPASGRVVSDEALSVIELVNSLPAEKRAAAVAVLQAAIELVKTGEHQQLPEPVSARQGGGVTNAGFAELGPQQKVKTGNDAGGAPPPGGEADQYTSARLEQLLALLEKMIPPQEYERVVELVNAGLPLTEADIVRLVESSGQQPLQRGFDLLNDEGTVS